MSNKHKNIYQDEYRAIIQRLIDARIKAGLTQEDVAKKLDKPQSYVSKIENCQRRLDVLEAKWLCELYGIRIDRLLNSKSN